MKSQNEFGRLFILSICPFQIMLPNNNALVVVGTIAVRFVIAIVGGENAELQTNAPLA